MKVNTLPALISHYRHHLQDKNAVACVGLSKYSRTSWYRKDFEAMIKQVRQFLYAQGLRKGDRLVICAPNSPLYLSIFLAAAHSGIVLVPIDVNSSDEFVADIIGRTKADLFVRSFLRASLGRGSAPELIIEDLPGLCAANTSLDLELVDISPDDVFEIVYTSGSTGHPKGVALTQGNIASNVDNLLQSWSIKQEYRFLSIIPLSHMFEQTVGTLVPYVTGNRIVYPASIKPVAIAQAMHQEGITTIIGVPALLQLLEHKIRMTAAKAGKVRLLNKLLKVARYLPMSGRRLLFHNIHAALGGKLRIVAVGGAPLPPTLERFWDCLGIDVLQGYGLTETAPVATLSLPAAKKFGSVGRSLQNQHITIGTDGEILLSGPNVFGGYFEDAENTKKAFSGKWYHTGDIGEIDNEGFLFLKGRKKNMILTASGLNVYPEDIETIMLEDTALRDCVILGLPKNDDIVITAILLPFPEHKAFNSERAIEMTNKRLASHQRIQAFETWPDADFPRTPTRKVKRQEIYDRYIKAAKSNAEHTADNAASNDALLKLIASIVGKSAAEIKESNAFVSDLQLDSIKRLELVSLLEENMNVMIEETSIGPTTTVQELRAIIAKAPAPTTVNLRYGITKVVIHSMLRPLLQFPILGAAGYFQKLEVHGRTDIPVHPVIFAANHTSHFDTLTVLRALSKNRRRNLSVAAAKDYFFNNWFKALMMSATLNAVPIDREGAIQESLQRLGRELAYGHSVLIYPEGTRGSASELQEFKAGVGLLSLSLSVPVVPVKITGNLQILPKGKRWPKRGHTKIIFGKPMYPSVTMTPEQVAEAIKKRVAEL